MALLHFTAITKMARYQKLFVALDVIISLYFPSIKFKSDNTLKLHCLTFRF